MRLRRLILGVAAVAASPFASMAEASGAGVADPPGYRFSDDDGNIHEGAIEAIAAAGITLGCGGGEEEYCPAEEVTRGQFASMLGRALGMTGPARDFFVDDDGSVHEDAINKLAEARIAAGCAPRRFCPGDSLSRAQMATLLVRALPDLKPTDRDFFVDDDGSVHEGAINKLTHNGVNAGCGPVRFCPQNPVRRDQMASFLAQSLGLAPTRPEPGPWGLELVIDGIAGGTTDLQAPAGDDRLFLATRNGLVRIIKDGDFRVEPFLDLTAAVITTGRERGLLGLAFHPDYAANGRFYVFYSDLDGHSQVYEYRTDSEDPNRADPSTARRIITFEQDERITHKAGQLHFGADGYLYIAAGDGGWGGDPVGHGQNPRTKLGTIMRIDVDRGDPYAVPPDNPFADGGGGLPEVWAYGLRNPWRFSFDGSLIYIADVGAATREEINVADAMLGGINYGWNIMEGSVCYPKAPDCDPAGLFHPQVDYPRNHTGTAVIGGYVYRGAAIPEMAGRYFYSDFSGGWIRTFLYEAGEVTEHYDWSRAVEVPDFVWSFGKDGHGELYVLAGPTVHKIVPR